MSDGGQNWLNFSEMGVGKTPEAIQTIEDGGYLVPLIVCPNSLRLEWKRQIGEWVGDDMTAISHPDSYKKLDALVYSFVKKWKKYRIINYETFRTPRFLELLTQMPFDIIVFDEIHKLRNPKTKQVKGVWEFLNALPNARIIGLSGSPIMNYPNDLYVPLSCVDPEKFPRDMQAYRLFMYRYCYWTDGQYGAYIQGTRNMGELKERTAPYVIRRTKKEVLPFLPEKTYTRTLLEMKDDQRKLYEEMENHLRVLLDTGEPLYSTNVLSTLTRLRQINLDPKIVGISASSAKTEYILDVVDSTDEKLVIFSCFEKYIYWLQLLFEKQGKKVAVVSGEVPPDKRLERVKQFQEDDSVQLFLGTIHTAGEGLTLTSAASGILADRWWNHPVNQQAEDRLHRIGQKNKVQIMIPLCADSVDESLDLILERKYMATEGYYQEGAVRQAIMEARGIKR